MKTKAQQLGITEFPYVERDENGNQTYFEYPEGYWNKCQYDENLNLNYYEDSGGIIIDNRPK